MNLRATHGRVLGRIALFAGLLLAGDIGAALARNISVPWIGQKTSSECGRAALASLGSSVRLVERPAPWAPRAAIELACSEGWTAHSSPELVYADLDAGRPALFDAIRWQAKLAHLTPPGRTYALAPDRDGLRLWVLTPAYRTVWAEIERAFAADDAGGAGRLAKAGLETVDELRLRGVQIADLEHIALHDPPRLLATPWTPGRDRLVGQLQRLFAAAVL